MPKYDEYTKEQLLEEINKLTKQKKFGLVWEDKPEDVVEQCKTNFPVLQEIPERAILNAKYAKEAQSTQTTIFDDNLCEPCENPLRPLRLEHPQPTHLIIEGDNYHALSVLNVTHKGKIDVIYIDPPYNRGENDFKYNDDYVDKEDSFRHSKWLSFMEKRLELAKNLLSDEGVIFISIDNNEFAQLKLLCDRILNENNFVEVFVWNKTSTPPALSKKSRKTHEYILCYQKLQNSEKFIGLIGEGGDAPLLNESNKEITLSFPSNSVNTNLADGIYEKGNKKRVILLDDVVVSNGYITNDFRLTGKFRWIQETVNAEIANNTFLIVKSEDFAIRYCREGQRTVAPANFLSDKLIYKTEINKKEDSVDTNEQAGKELIDVLGSKKFDFPKPISLIKYLISFKEDYHKDFVILDFFAGSGTTGHAVLELNKEDGGNRQFILCTNNENGICEEVTYPRIKTVITGNREDGSKYSDGIPANVRYFKTDFVQNRGLDDVSDEDRVNLTLKAGSMIAIKENVFQQTELNEWWQIFEEGEKMVAIYFKESKVRINELIEKIGGEKCVLYIFGWGKNEYAEEYGAENIEIKDIPEPILKIYKQINSIKN